MKSLKKSQRETLNKQMFKCIGKAVLNEPNDV